MTDFNLPPLNQRPDEYRRVREIRLAMEKEVERVKAYERAIENSLIADIPRDSAGVFGLQFKAQRTEKETVRVSPEGWPVLASYIAQTGRFDFMQKRINPAAIKEMLDAGHQVPGVERFIEVGLSVTKV